MTLGTEVAVIERGSVGQRMRDEAKRALILGVGALEGMTRQQLRAVLAHEYGHFSNRDTAGGRLPAVVQTSLFASLVRIARGGGATFYNPAWHFVRGFHALFLRITLGASRLRELMADQFAAVVYGGQAFAGGLTHIVRRSLEFDRNLDVLANRAQMDAQPIASLLRDAHRAAGRASGPGGEVPRADERRGLALRQPPAARLPHQLGGPAVRRRRRATARRRRTGLEPVLEPRGAGARDDDRWRTAAWRPPAHS